MTNPVIESVYPGEFILSEGPRGRSRDTILIGASQALLSGTVLGYSSIGTLAAAIAALGTNTGNPTFNAPTVAAGTEMGEYDVVMDDATHFTVFQPPASPQDVPGEVVGHGVFGTAFAAGGLGFTGTAGGTPCAPGDSFKLTVTQSGALDEYVRLNPSATDGSQNAAAISFGPVTTGASATQKALAITREAEVKSGMLDWGTLSGPQIAAATLQLQALQIIQR